MGLIIDWLAHDGSPLGVSTRTMMGDDPKQIGCGGAEQAMLTLCEGMQKAGHAIRLYNDPREPNASPFPQFPLSAFNPQEDRDVLIVFRSPNERISGAKGLKVWFSCDPYTMGDYRAFAPRVDKIVTISPLHAEYFKNTYGIENTITIDLPVRSWEYEKKVDKVPFRCLFSSVPDRGLHQLIDMWPHILARVPEASLVITSDYRLWGCDTPRNEGYIPRIVGMGNTQMLGAVKRERLVEEQLKAEYLVYPSSYQELFCIACAEAQVAGMYPITTQTGALITTNMGTKIDQNDPNWQAVFLNTVCELLISRKKDTDLQKRAKKRFGIDRIIKEWETKVFTR